MNNMGSFSFILRNYNELVYQTLTTENHEMP